MASVSGTARSSLNTTSGKPAARLKRAGSRPPMPQVGSAPRRRRARSTSAGESRARLPRRANLRDSWASSLTRYSTSAAAACAATVVSYLNNVIPVPETVVFQPGGHLEVFWAEDNHVYVTGSAECVFEGTMYPPLELLPREEAQAMLLEEEKRQGGKNRIGAKELELEIQRKIDRHIDRQLIT
mmetsp:Transcript_17553/g.49381  ORF Transcript_17553/g.49381 Transcript_17553/m.49381 type:complete len:184 (+) Transcript_17553:1338-1889(+)